MKVSPCYCYFVVGFFVSLVHDSSQMFLVPSSSVYTSGCSEGPFVFITINSIAKSKGGMLKDRMIEMNWNQAEPEPGDYVALYDHQPDDVGSDPLVQEPILITKGHVKTDYRFDRKPFRIGQDPCLGYWIAYIRHARVIIKNCLRMYPDWMHESRDVIGDSPLHSLMIPGTHNSGSWREYDGPNSDTVFLRYLVNQDESVYRQLLHGIRYVDIRVGFYPTGAEKFWINHNFYRMRPLSEVISDIKQFVSETNEIVIVDFHRFPVGFDGRRDRHVQLVEYLNTELGEYAVPSTLWPNARLNEIWQSNKSVIIAYSEARIAQQFPFLWPPLPQEWGDKQNLPTLREFLSESIKRRGGKGQVWAAMAEFTPKPLDIVLRPTQGLRNFAQKVNPWLSNVIHEDRQWLTKSNIIATDFFLGNNVIQTSINANYKRLKCV